MVNGDGGDSAACSFVCLFVRLFARLFLPLSFLYSFFFFFHLSHSRELNVAACRATNRSYPSRRLRNAGSNLKLFRARGMAGRGGGRGGRAGGAHGANISRSVYDFISLPVILRRARKQFKIDDSRLMIPARGIPSSPGDDAFSIAIAPYAFAYLYNRTVPRARAIQNF